MPSMTSPWKLHGVLLLCSTGRSSEVDLASSWKFVAILEITSTAAGGPSAGPPPPWPPCPLPDNTRTRILVSGSLSGVSQLCTNCKFLTSPSLSFLLHRTWILLMAPPPRVSTRLQWESTCEGRTAECPAWTTVLTFLPLSLSLPLPETARPAGTNGRSALKRWVRGPHGTWLHGLRRVKASGSFTTPL